MRRIVLKMEMSSVEAFDILREIVWEFGPDAVQHSVHLADAD